MQRLYSTRIAILNEYTYFSSKPVEHFERKLKYGKTIHSSSLRNILILEYISTSSGGNSNQVLIVLHQFLSISKLRMVQYQHRCPNLLFYFIFNSILRPQGVTTWPVSSITFLLWWRNSIDMVGWNDVLVPLAD